MTLSLCMKTIKIFGETFSDLNIIHGLGIALLFDVKISYFLLVHLI